MKKRLLIILTSATLALSACSFFGTNTYKTYEKELSVYDLDHLGTSNDLSSGLDKTIKARFIEGEDLVPYLTLKQYASLYDSHFDAEVSNTVEHSFFSDVWTIYKGNQPYFMAQVSTTFEQIALAGSIQAALSEDDDPRDLTVLTWGLKNDTDGKYIGDASYTSLDFSPYSIKYFDYKDETYFPLGFLDNTFVGASAMYFEYNYKHIILTRDVENLASVKYIDEGKEYTFNSQMEEMVKDVSAPSYLMNYNANIFLYVMDNFYGLKKEKGINTFKYYLEKGNGKYNMYSAIRNTSDGETRGWGYSDALSSLDDNHTLLVTANESWGESIASMTRRLGDGCKQRAQTKSTLQTLRKNVFGASEAIEDVRYSNDGKTAYIAFDNFIYGEPDQVFNEDGSIKPTAGKYDSFFRLISGFKTIKERGGVENVIIDISLNGGGVLGIMLKLLALISSDNNSEISLYEDTSTQLAIYNPHVDINNDQLYNQEDCFGDDFNMYILTSDCSFSCGNAFPCAAQKVGSAKIIGQKSGGGECVVGVHYMPNSEYVYHSSNTHIGSTNAEKTTFTGFENGATPDIPVEIGENFYSIEYLNTLIQTAH